MKKKELKKENETLNNRIGCDSYEVSILKLQGKIISLNKEIDFLKKELSEKPNIFRRIKKLGDAEIVLEIETSNTNTNLGDDLKLFLGVTK